MLANEGQSAVSTITSRLVSYPGPHGLRISAYIDEGPNELWNERFVILAPRYGETKKNNLQLSYTLVANGFKVLRFDQTNHIGESDGTMEKFTLGNAAEDILASVAYADQYAEPTEIILVTLSLSSRCGLRACAKEPRISRFASIVGMVDMDRTLQSIYKRDFFGELSEGAEWRLVDILGFEIDGAHFHDSLLETGMKDLAGTLKDAREVQIPVLHLYAEKDLWVDREDVRKVIGNCKQGKLVEIPAVGHEINEKNDAVNFAFGQVIGFCLQGLDRGKNGAPAEILQPDTKTLIKQNKLERNRLKKIFNFSRDEEDFWGDYLGKFGIIEDAHYYVDYFKGMSELLGRLNRGDVLLDAGCGNGFYGMSIVRSLIQSAGVESGIPGPIHYCGIDLTPEGLGKAYSRQTDELLQLFKEEVATVGSVAFSYRKADFDKLNKQKGMRLPFEDGSVNKICCSLVISYLKSPVELLQEFHRMLVPNGVAVISSMKPGCDMTVLYHDYLSVDNPTQDRNQNAQQLLSAAGRIKLKKDSGVYAFFTEEELQYLAFEAGFTQIEASQSFGGQANLIRVVK